MAKLKVFEDSNLVLEQDLSEGTVLTIGRGSESDIKLEPHPGISRDHAVIKYEDGQVRIDLVSSSGVLVQNGQTVKEHVFSEVATTASIPPYNFTVELPAPQVIAEENEDQEEEAFESFDDSNLPSSDAGLVDNTAQSPMAVQDFNEEDDNEKTSVGSQQALDYAIKVFRASKFLQEIEIKGNNWIFGRGDDCDYTINSKKSSRTHFNILKIGASFYVKDLGSSNGTLLNNQQLPANQEVELKSGDYIELAEYKFIFEIKDKKFQEKIKNISLIEEAVTSNQEDLSAIRSQAHVVSDETLRLGGSASQQVGAKDKRSNFIRFILIIAIAGMGAFYFMGGQGNKIDMTELASLAETKRMQEEKKNAAIDKFNLALRFYNESQFGRCVLEVDDFLAMDIQTEETSGAEELRNQCDIEKERLQRQKDLELQEQKKAELEARVSALIDACRDQVVQGTEVLRNCLLEAESIDPTNSEIAALYDEAQAIELEKAQRDEERKAYLNRVARGKGIYDQAKDFQKHGDWKRALKTFNEFIKSRYPDPGAYKDKARREVASINLSIGSQIEEALRLSKKFLQDGEYKEAILAANKGLEVNRDHVELLEVKTEAVKLLKIILRRYYQESIIEEDFGEIAEAKIKWKKIIEQGVEGSEYYSKAQLKLKYYEEGFQ